MRLLANGRLLALLAYIRLRPKLLTVPNALTYFECNIVRHAHPSKSFKSIIFKLQKWHTPFWN